MSGDKVSANLKVQRNDANNTWIACVGFSDGHRVHSENMDRYTAIENVKKLARHHANTTAIKPKDTSDWTIKTDDTGIITGMQSFNDHLKASEISVPSLREQLASDMFEQEKVMAGLIEKAKRTGLDHRLIAMANTDFERGFMALDKALTTNIG